MYNASCGMFLALLFTFNYKLITKYIDRLQNIQGQAFSVIVKLHMRILYFLIYTVVIEQLSFC